MSSLLPIEEYMRYKTINYNIVVEFHDVVDETVRMMRDIFIEDLGAAAAASLYI